MSHAGSQLLSSGFHLMSPKSAEGLVAQSVGRQLALDKSGQPRFSQLGEFQIVSGAGVRLGPFCRTGLLVLGRRNRGPRNSSVGGQQDHIPGCTFWSETYILPYPFS